METLTDWERVLDLDGTGTTDERIALVVAAMINRQRFRPQSVLDALIDVLPNPVMIEVSAAEALEQNNPRLIFRFFVFQDPLDPLGPGDIVGAQLVIDRMKHSHTQGFAIQSTNFLCNDPFSLCDRDILGV